MIRVQNEPIPLPMHVSTAPARQHRLIQMFTLLIIKEVKQHMLSHCHHSVKKIVQAIWQHGYSRGLKDMDAMHGKV